MEGSYFFMKSLYKEITIYGTELFRNTRHSNNLKDFMNHYYKGKFYYDRLRIETINEKDIIFYLYSEMEIFYE